MGSTNKTVNYELSQFLGSDKPAWLLDYNGDMLKIDTAIKAASDDAAAAQSKANTADGKADANALNIATLDAEINGSGGTSGLAQDVSTLQGNVDTINSLIGNGTPTTTDKTLIGAINELDADFKVKLGWKGAVEVARVYGDGTKTLETLLSELNTALNAAIASYSPTKQVNITELGLSGIGYFKARQARILDGSQSGVSVSFQTAFLDATNYTFTQIDCAADAAYCKARRVTIDTTPSVSIADLTNVLTSSQSIWIVGDLFEA